MTLTSTNTRTATCLDCRRSILPGEGARIGSRYAYACANCVGVRNIQDAAFRYQGQILARVSDLSDRWLLSGDLSRLIYRLGPASAMVLQAVLDRTGDLKPTYQIVMTIAQEERKAIGA